MSLPLDSLRGTERVHTSIDSVRLKKNPDTVFMPPLTSLSEQSDLFI